MSFQEHDWLEQELKSALARKDPPPGFAETVAEEAADEPSGRRGNVIAWPSRRTSRWVAAAAAVVLAVTGAMAYRHHQGVEAKNQVMRAFFMAGGKLNHLQEHLKEVSQ